MPATRTVTPTTVENFYVGGHYETSDTKGGAYAHSGGAPGQVMVGQALVEHYSAPHRRSEVPILAVAHKSSVPWYRQTPDGRPGWIPQFLEAGYDVYVLIQVDPTAFGGASSPRTTRDSESIVTATDRHGLWGRAALHTQWPGTGQPGDPTFDHFFASVGPKWRSEEHDASAMEQSRDAAAALIDRIGRVIVFTHSQSGELGWLIADARPGLVPAVFAIDPMGPPFIDAPPRARGETRISRHYGPTRAPLVYDPPVSDPAVDLPFVTTESADGSDLEPLRLQAEPAKRLVNVAQSKVLVVTGEASYHAHYDARTVAYLRQAGVDVTHWELGDLGIHGNGHNLIFEANSAEIADRITGWLAEQGFVTDDADEHTGSVTA